MAVISRWGPPAAIGRLIAAHIGLHAALAGMRMATPLLALSQGYSTGVAGCLVALFAIAQILLAIPAGRLVDRHGVKRLLTCCAVVSSSGIALSVVAPNLPLLGVSALCCGAAVGVSLVTLQRHIGLTARSDDDLRQGLAWLSIAPSISIFIGPLIGGVLIDASGFRAAFLVLALLPLGALLAARSAPGAFARVSASAPRRSPWSLWRVPEFRRLLLLNWLMTAAWDLHGFMLPVLGHERGLSASWIGVLLGLFAIAATFSRLSVPAVARRASEWTIVSVAVTLAAGLFGAYPLLSNVFAMAAFSFLLGMLLGSVQPTVLILLHKVVPEERHGDAIAMRLMMVNGSGIAMPMLFGAAGAWITVSGVFYATAAMVGMGGGIGLARRHAFAAETGVSQAQEGSEPPRRGG